MNLAQYITEHTTMVGDENGTADVFFFCVKKDDKADAEELKKLISEQKGEYCEIDLLDKKEHGYIEIGAWIGSQELALRLMGLGSLLGLWNLMTPMSILGFKKDEDICKDMAGAGYVIIQAQ